MGRYTEVHEEMKKTYRPKLSDEYSSQKATNGVTEWHEQIYPEPGEIVLVHLSDLCIDKTELHELSILRFDKLGKEYGRNSNSPVWEAPESLRYVNYDIADKWAYLPSLTDKRWISGEKRLPEIGEYVLAIHDYDIYDSNLVVDIGYRDGYDLDVDEFIPLCEEDYDEEVEYFTSFYGSTMTGWQSEIKREPDLVKIIKWMPLSELK